MTKRLIYLLAAISAVLALATIFIAYGRGMRIDIKNKSISTIGILSANSSPNQASIYIDNKLSSATNTSITLSPGWYQVKIAKEGYQSWEKKVRIQGEIVTKIDALLLPVNPTLRPITHTGVSIISLSPLADKVAFIVEDNEATSATKSKTGIWVQELRNGTLGGRTPARQILSATLVPGKHNWQNSKLIWSPDEKQMIIFFLQKEKNKEKITAAYQTSTEDSNLIPQDVLFSHEKITDEWKKEEKTNLDNLIGSQNPQLSAFLTGVTNLKFSPDETKILYQATKSAKLQTILSPPLIGSYSTSQQRDVISGKYYIYDLKEDKNFLIADEKTPRGSLVWFYDSKHLILIEKNTISIVDYDGVNKRTVYTGPFEDQIVFPWNGDGKIVILTNFNKPSALPNLYEIDLR